MNTQVGEYEVVIRLPEAKSPANRYIPIYNGLLTLHAVEADVYFQVATDKDDRDLVGNFQAADHAARQALMRIRRVARIAQPMIGQSEHIPEWIAPPQVFDVLTLQRVAAKHSWGSEPAIVYPTLRP